jgi:hypothetical protein
MTNMGIIKTLVFVAVLLGTGATSFAQTSFGNLNFESAQIIPIVGSSNYP